MPPVATAKRYAAKDQNSYVRLSLLVLSDRSGCQSDSEEGYDGSGGIGDGTTPTANALVCGQNPTGATCGTDTVSCHCVSTVAL